MGAKRWGDALPHAQEKADELAELKALLVAKGVLTEEEASPEKKGSKRKN